MQMPHWLRSGLRRAGLEMLVAALLVLALLAISWPLWQHAPHWPAHWKAIAAGAAILLTLLILALQQWLAPPRVADARHRFWRLMQAATVSLLLTLGCLHWWHAHPWTGGGHAWTEQFICQLGVRAEQLNDATQQALTDPGAAPCRPVVKGGGPQGLPPAQVGASMLAQYQWVQCAPAGPRRCASVAWLTQQQHDMAVRPAAAASTAGKPAGTGGIATPARATNTAVETATGTVGPAPGTHADTSPIDQTLALVATILAVVLTVTTLIATKTASDARDEVRAEIGRLDAARQAQTDAMHAQAAMLATILLQTQQRLVHKHVRPGDAFAADAALLAGHLRPLTEVLYGLSGLASGRGDAQTLLGKVDKLLDQLQLKPLRQLPAGLLDGLLRGVLRDTAQLLLAHLSLLNRTGRNFTDTENKSRESLHRLAQRLGDV